MRKGVKEPEEVPSTTVGGWRLEIQTAVQMQVSFKPRPSEFWVREEKVEGHTTWLIERCYRTGELEEGMVVAHTPAHKPLKVGLWGAVWFISGLMSQDMHKMALKAPTMEEWPSCHAFPTMTTLLAPSETVRKMLMSEQHKSTTQPLTLLVLI